MVRHLVIILGDQLTLDNPALVGFDSAQDKVLMAEVLEESTIVWNHRARIVLFLSAMRHFAQVLSQQKITLEYFKLGEHPYHSFEQLWSSVLKQAAPQKVLVCEPGAHRVQEVLQRVCHAKNVPLEILEDTSFLCSRAQFSRWAGDSSTLRMEFFYRLMRRRYNLLLDNQHQPIGGQWNFDAENRKSFGKHGPGKLPPSPYETTDAITQAVMGDVLQNFPDHPGEIGPFIWPVTREQALKLLDDFIMHKLEGFGDYQDAMWSVELPEHGFLWHSLLASSLNLKLLHPLEVVQAALESYTQGRASLASVEGFIRQIIGWREFIRGVYWLDMPHMAEANFFRHTRPLPKWYWTGRTHMRCMQQVIHQILQTGYAHHIQRLMVTGMFALLAELDPKAVSDWYLAVFVDAVEWVELPNVAGMALFANGGRFTSKPYIASGAYINKMSNYCGSCRYRFQDKTGDKACPVTVLYWLFLIKHADRFRKNPRMRMMLKHVDNMSIDMRQAITEQDEDYLARISSL